MPPSSSPISSVVPDALGQKVWFEEGEGPKLEALTDPADFGRLTRARLPEKSWRRSTRRSARSARNCLRRRRCWVLPARPSRLPSYMIEGGGSQDFAKVKELGLSPTPIPSAC